MLLLATRICLGTIIEVDMEMEKRETSVHWCRIRQKDFNTEGRGKGTFVRFSSRWKERIQSNMHIQASISATSTIIRAFSFLASENNSAYLIHQNRKEVWQLWKWLKFYSSHSLKLVWRKVPNTAFNKTHKCHAPTFERYIKWWKVNTG